MDFDLSDEQKMLVDGAERYAREKLGLEARRATAASAEGLLRERWLEFADMGWLGLPIAAELGGLGGSDVDLALLMEVLGHGLAAQPYADTAILGSTLIAASGNVKARSELLDGVAAGQCITALAHLENEGRCEYETSVRTRAIETPRGWRLHGIKPEVVNAVAASHWLVSARIEGTDGLAIFVVDRADAAAASVRSYELIDGARAADLELNDTPATPLIIDPALATDALELALDRTIVALAAACVGSMEAVMSLTAAYLKQRTQFGQTLSKFQALQHRVAEMFVETDQARAMLYHALAGMVSGDANRRRRSASGAKALVTQAGYFVAAQGIQLHGGIGITEEYAVAHHYKSMLSYARRYGDRDFHLARSVGLPPGPQ